MIFVKLADRYRLPTIFVHFFTITGLYQFGRDALFSSQGGMASCQGIMSCDRWQVYVAIVTCRVLCGSRCVSQSCVV